MSDGELLAILDGSSNADHDFSAMGEQALGSLVTFLQEGQVNMKDYIDYESKAPIAGNAEEGEELFEGTCAACHGADGRKLNFGSADEPEFVGTIAADNPWEFAHKVRAGQPGTAMPSAIDLGWSIEDVMNVLAFAQTLPSGPPEPTAASRGGRLYDKWWKEAGVDEPSGDMPVWARQDTNTRSGTSTWRCKECHGWDYKGAEGAYGSGSHFTGFPGIFNAQDKSVDDLVAQISGGIDPEHDFSAMGDQAILDLVSFIKEGLVDLTTVIDYETKAPIDGDLEEGEELYEGSCAACHGDDGRLLNFGSADEPEYVGTIAVDNPWEFVHKVRAGQPGTGMPSAIDGGWNLKDVIDLLAYSQTLPTEAP
jgi:thiosulfate dehydrogenase